MASPADFTVERQAASILAINEDAAEAQGVTFPEAIMKRAAEIISSG
jgi:ABC-type uncharacterized transport system substrate-binding protein